MLRIFYLRLLISVKEAITLETEACPQCCSPKSVTPSLTFLLLGSAAQVFQGWPADMLPTPQTGKPPSVWMHEWDRDSYLLPCSCLCMTLLLQPVPATTEPFHRNSPPQESFLPWWEPMLGSTAAPLDSHDAFGFFSILSSSYRGKKQIVKEQKQL